MPWPPSANISVGQFSKVAIMLERFRIGESLFVFDLAPMHDFPHGKLGDLARLGPRNICHLHHFRWHVAWTGAAADLLLDALAQRRVEAQPRLQDDEQDHAHVVLPVLTDHDALLHFLQLLDLAIDFRRADAYAARVEGGIGTPMNNDAAVFGPFREVAMVPDIVEA